MRIGAVVGLAVLAGAGAASAAVIAASGWAVRSIPTPQPVQGGVIAQGSALLVGQGSFGAGQQSVVRIVDGTATALASGFNSLGGFALAPDATLYVVDNGGELGGATTGDTLYAIPDALTRATAVAAADVAVVPAGTFPSAADVLRLPSGRLLVSESTGPGVGRIAAVDGTTVSPLVSDLDYASGLALAGSTLLLANLDGSFAGAVRRFALDGMELTALATNLGGAYALAVDAQGFVLVSGTNAVVALDAGGNATDRATGFAFSTELFFDASRDETLVLDAGASEVTAICRDVNGDAVCDADAVATTTTTTTSTTTTTLVALCDEATVLRPSRLVLGNRLTPDAPGDAPVTFRAKQRVPGGTPRALPRQEGLTVTVFDGEAVRFRLEVPGGLGWRRDPDLGWVYRDELPGLGSVEVRVRVTASTLGVTLRASAGGTVPGDTVATGLRAQVQVGAVCGEGGFRRCRRRREQLWCR